MFWNGLGKPHQLEKDSNKKPMRSLVFGCFPSALAGYKYCIIETVPVDKQLPTSVEVYKTLMFNKICIVSIGTGFRSSTVSSWLYTIYIYNILVPGTQMTSIFEGKPHKTRPFPIKTSVSWVPGIYIYIHTNIPMRQNPKVLKNTAGETIREIAAGEAA